ncbi:Oxidoreductase OS=Bosea thiooxidans OX=53254 GN=ARD30_01790 PE=4 SV=1 [Bosea thiooxidans]
MILPNSVPFAALAPFLPQLSLVAIAFPAYADGRGFSLARQIRRADFTGEIRASGPLIADQFAYALSCGFDTF